jgi:hypothetical protein
MSWQSAVVWVAVIVFLFGLPVLVKKWPAREDRAVLEELRSMGGELQSLRAEVAELDRVLKSVG